MPGKKDYVSVTRNVRMQKRLVLCNIRTLFTAFKVRYPEVKIGFSKFCSLKPKWCILAGASGTHTVCVCAIHQNIKLFLTPVNMHYKYLLPFLVCNPENRECMVNRCAPCPVSLGPLKEPLVELAWENQLYEIN